MATKTATKSRTIVKNPSLIAGHIKKGDRFTNRTTGSMATVQGYTNRDKKMMQFTNGAGKVVAMATAKFRVEFERAR